MTSDPLDRIEIDRLRGLLREWRQAADIAQDLTFVPIARKTDAALAGTASQPPVVHPWCADCAETHPEGQHTYDRTADNQELSK